MIILNNNALLIVFIDAFPFKCKSILLDLLHDNIQSIVELIPEIGYSSNQHPALFSGLLPDEVGYFTDWDYNGSKFGCKINYLKHDSNINFFINYLSSKIGLTSNNIPIGLKKYFSSKGIYYFKNPDKFKLLRINKLANFKLRYAKLNKEFEMLDKLNEIKFTEKEFIVINSIDHWGHLFGPYCMRYKELIINLIKKTSNIVNNFMKQYPKGKVMIISDHGMTVINRRKNLILEEMFGKQGKKYIYFIDSVILRVWCIDEIYYNIKKYLTEESCKVLNKSERIYYGLTKKSFGSIIAIAPAGTVFNPNYFGTGIRHRVRGMHGYFPDEKTQHGIMVCNFNLREKIVRNKNIFDIISKVIKT